MILIFYRLGTYIYSITCDSTPFWFKVRENSKIYLTTNTSYILSRYCNFIDLPNTQLWPHTLLYHKLTYTQTWRRLSEYSIAVSADSLLHWQTCDVTKVNDGLRRHMTAAIYSVLTRWSGICLLFYMLSMHYSHFQHRFIFAYNILQFLENIELDKSMMLTRSTNLFQCI